jgi:hypothetical protein
MATFIAGLLIGVVIGAVTMLIVTVIEGRRVFYNVFREEQRRRFRTPRWKGWLRPPTLR